MPNEYKWDAAAEKNKNKASKVAKDIAYTEVDEPFFSDIDMGNAVLSTYGVPYRNSSADVPDSKGYIQNWKEQQEKEAESEQMFAPTPDYIKENNESDVADTYSYEDMKKDLIESRIDIPLFYTVEAYNDFLSGDFASGMFSLMRGMSNTMGKTIRKTKVFSRMVRKK